MEFYSDSRDEELQGCSVHVAGEHPSDELGTVTPPLGMTGAPGMLKGARAPQGGDLGLLGL